MLRAQLHRVALALVAVASFLAITLTAPRARAQRELLSPLGGKGTLAIDQVSGFRASTVGGVGYAGPIGFSTQSLSVDITDNQGRAAGSDTIHYTTIWIAPSADYFVIDHLSIGGVLEIASTSQSFTETLNGPPQTSQTTSLPTLTNITFIPRVGWMFAITDRFGIWPRGGIGYASRSTSSLNPVQNAGSSDTFGAFVFDVDVGFLYRVNENWFLRGAPELTFAPGSVSHQTGNVTTSTNGQFFQFAVVGGIGVMWDLL